MLQDYNDIFSLVTLPNLFLTWYISRHGTSDTEFEVNSDLKFQFLSTLNALGIEISFIVGAWGPSLIVRPSYIFKLTRNLYQLMISFYLQKEYTPLHHFLNSRT